jgi:hypothetical protein
VNLHPNPSAPLTLLCPKSLEGKACGGKTSATHPQEARVGLVGTVVEAAVRAAHICGRRCVVVRAAALYQ